MFAAAEGTLDRLDHHIRSLCLRGIGGRMDRVEIEMEVKQTAGYQLVRNHHWCGKNLMLAVLDLYRFSVYLLYEETKDYRYVSDADGEVRPTE